jgi:GNAT superfamily N-acetyltransferase
VTSKPGIGMETHKRAAALLRGDFLRELPPECRPLLRKFYQAHHSHMRIPAGARCWVAGRGEISAALCLVPVRDGSWLTGLLVAPSMRHIGLASRLVAHARRCNEGPIWLFCEPGLAGFYLQLGFSEPADLPATLADRLQRYNRNKTLISLCHENLDARCPSTS